MALMEPLVRETIDNVFRLGTRDALTGPVARGDAGVVRRQLLALEQSDLRAADAYRALGLIAAEIARARGGDAGALADIERLLSGRD